MKRLALTLALIVVLSGCGKSDQELAKDLVKQSCNSKSVAKTESLIREAVQLDEKYRPYLIAWLKWQQGKELVKVSAGISEEALANAITNLSNNFSVQDSYCDKWETMKRLTISLVLLLLLTGCSSAPTISVEEQAKLIEYDNCIKIISDGKMNPSIYFQYTLEECAKYRP